MFPDVQRGAAKNDIPATVRQTKSRDRHSKSGFLSSRPSDYGSDCFASLHLCENIHCQRILPNIDILERQGLARLQSLYIVKLSKYSKNRSQEARDQSVF
jgi:hypothetical protein